MSVTKEDWDCFTALAEPSESGVPRAERERLALPINAIVRYQGDEPPVRSAPG